MVRWNRDAWAGPRQELTEVSSSSSPFFFLLSASVPHLIPLDFVVLVRLLFLRVLFQMVTLLEQDILRLLHLYFAYVFRRGLVFEEVKRVGLLAPSGQASPFLVELC
jgi:hypothetical protein